MDIDYPLKTYVWGDKHCSGADSLKSSAYDSVQVDLGSLDGGPLPRRTANSTSGRSDETLLYQHEIPDPRPPRRRPTHSAHLAFFKWWIPEILASIFAIWAILGIAIVLYVYDGRGLDNLNLPDGLTLNGLIAAIATFDRVFLIVPVGSAISQEAWLWFASNDHKENPRSRLRDLNLSDNASRGAWGSIIFIFYTPWRWLTLFGCLISVLSLAIGTFTQQLIGIENLPVKDNFSALSPGHIQRSQFFNSFTGNPAEVAFGPFLNMKAAIYNGFMTPNIDSVTATCPSGNCTFPSTPSLAICGDCALTAYDLSGCNSTDCTYTTASGSLFKMPNWTSSSAGVGFVSQASYGRQFDKRKGDGYYIANFETLGVRYGSFSGSMEGQSHPNYTAHECALWFCVNTYNTTISNGKQMQSIVDSYKTPAASKKDVLYTASTIYPNITYQGSNYTLYWLGYEALIQNLANLINGTIILNLEGFKPSSDVTEAIWSGTSDPSTWIHNIAVSMSNVVRNTNPSSSTQFTGTAYQLGIRVHWWWLTLPIAIVASSILLLIIVMIRTSRSDISAWKGSPLTFLLFEVDNDIRQAVNDAGWTGIASGIERSVGQRKVTLKRKEGRWEGFGGPGAWVFRGVDGSGHDSVVR